tara:strand:- start:26868 stop:27839 length:972 start_codon:yes stop_codon:yes gene_type:complete
VQVLHQLPKLNNPSLLTGIHSRDDAAVYKLDENTAIVQSVDFFPPNVDDPFTYGEIAAANAISDIYAMGGKPIFALNIVSFPDNLPNAILNDIIAGGSSKATEAGMLIVGGHTIKNDVPIYGLSVTGTIKPGSEILNSSCQNNDLLLLTKPIGSGIITTAAKSDAVNKESLNQCINIMKTLNNKASDAMIKSTINACTDITGFGLIGHILEMTQDSELMATIKLDNVPIMDNAYEAALAGHVPSGTRENLRACEKSVEWASNISLENKLILCDAQTSGGLVISVSPDNLDNLVNKLKQNGISDYAIIGEVNLRKDASTQIIVN